MINVRVECVLKTIEVLGISEVYVFKGFGLCNFFSELVWRAQRCSAAVMVLWEANGSSRVVEWASNCD